MIALNGPRNRERLIVEIEESRIRPTKEIRCLGINRTQSVGDIRLLYKEGNGSNGKDDTELWGGGENKSASFV